MAEGLGEHEKADRYRFLYDNYYNAFIAVLNRVTQQTGGYITPGLDSQGGQDWGNLMAVYPEQILNPADPRVSNTLEVSRAKYREGVMTYLDQQYLHHYLTIKNTETHIVRGEQELAVRDLYAVLLHTSSTHAGFEWHIRPWGDRDFGFNLSPHGWFAAQYRTLLRNMLVREDGPDIHLLSAISPTWIGAGRRIAVRNAPTHYGPLSFSLECTGDGARLTISARFREKPDQFRIHVPWFVELREAWAVGNQLHAPDGMLRIGPDVTQVRLLWNVRPVKGLSYDEYVQDYLKEYRDRYEKFLKKGR
jgi:hypothetical protein